MAKKTKNTPILLEGEHYQTAHFFDWNQGGLCFQFRGPFAYNIGNPRKEEEAWIEDVLSHYEDFRYEGFGKEMTLGFALDATKFNTGGGLGNYWLKILISFYSSKFGSWGRPRWITVDEACEMNLICISRVGSI